MITKREKHKVSILGRREMTSAQMPWIKKGN